jgi:hypothetical protein
MYWLELSVKVFTIVGGAIAILTFWRTVKIRRAEWLSSLHAKFFEGSSYTRVRRILDSGETDRELAQLRNELGADQNSELAEEFVNYLNFFEFVASLRKFGQIRQAEIAMLFDYYLRLLCKHEFVRTYVRKNGFEELDALLRECVERRSK